jgi:hypothetical protein
MAFPLNNSACWGLAVVASAISIVLSIWPIAEEVRGQSSALLLGMLCTYAVLSNYLVFRLIAWIDAKSMRLGKIVGVALAVLFLLGVSWVVFGRYFYLSASQGLQSSDQLVTDFVIRRAMQVQQLLAVLLSLLVIRRGGRGDLVGSLLAAGVVAVLILG